MLDKPDGWLKLRLGSTREAPVIKRRQQGGSVMMWAAIYLELNRPCKTDHAVRVISEF